MIKTKRTIFIIIILFVLILPSVFLYCKYSGKQEDYIYKYSSIKSNDNIEKKIKNKVSFNYSTEGATLMGIYSVEEKLQYLNIDILGELGRGIHEYSFTDDNIVYSYIEILYKEPYYIDPQNIEVNKANYKKYIIYNDNVYDYTTGESLEPVSKEFQEEVIFRMQDFIKALEEDDLIN